MVALFLLTDRKRAFLSGKPGKSLMMSGQNYAIQFPVKEFVIFLSCKK